MSTSERPRRSSKSQVRAERRALAERRAQKQRLLRNAGIAVGIAAILTVVIIAVTMPSRSSSGGEIDYATLPTDGRSLGNPDAPVTFVIYSDFQCPFCKQFDDRELPRIVDDFVRDGTVRVEWHPVPVVSGAAGIPLESPENESVQSSEAALCAAEQDAFWPYAEALFAEQGRANTGVYSDEMLKQTAADLDLDTAAFDACLDSGAMEDEVLALRQEALDLGVSGTPMFLIDGELVAYSRGGYDDLESRIREAVERRTEGG